MELPPMFPSLLPKVADPIWFCVDKPCDDESELTKLEDEHKAWLHAIATNKSETLPIGKTSDLGDEEDEEEDEDADVDDETDTNDDDELDTDMIDDRDSPDEADMEANDPQIESPPWGL